MFATSAKKCQEHKKQRFDPDTPKTSLFSRSPRFHYCPLIVIVSGMDSGGSPPSPNSSGSRASFISSAPPALFFHLCVRRRPPHSLDGPFPYTSIPHPPPVISSTALFVAVACTTTSVSSSSTDSATSSSSAGDDVVLGFLRFSLQCGSFVGSLGAFLVGRRQRRLFFSRLLFQKG